MAEEKSNNKSVPKDEGREEKERADRLQQSSIEFWKIEYDFFKHMMTVSLAAVAAFGAMLGGVFQSDVWEPDWLLNVLSLSRNLVIILTFSAFIVSAVSATLGMIHAADCVYQSGSMEKAKDIVHFQHMKRQLSSKRVVQGLIIILSFGFGVLMFLLFIFGNVRV